MSAMDIKLNHHQDAIKGRWGAKRKRFLTFLQDLKDEMRKVSWTTREELMTATKAVVATTFILGIGIYLVDLLIRGGLDAIAIVVRYIFG